MTIDDARKRMAQEEPGFSPAGEVEAAVAQTDEQLETYTVIFYDPESATLEIMRVYAKGSYRSHSIPIAEFLTSSTDLQIILTDEGELDVKK